MKRLGWILALCLGGGALYYSANEHSGVDGAQRQPAATQTAQPATTPSSSQNTLSNDNHYTNSSGDRVHSPARSSEGVPSGASAVCRDGSYSFSEHRQGTCSHHGGVENWL